MALLRQTGSRLHHLGEHFELLSAISGNRYVLSAPVARIEDVLQGKIWAAMDTTRRQSKRQKDLADIARLTETDRKLISQLPQSLRKQLSL